MTNFRLDDPVIDYIMPTFETVMVMISQVYFCKIARDVKEVGSKHR